MKNIRGLESVGFNGNMDGKENWGKVKEKLKEFRWKVQRARRKNKKGKAMGGMIVGIKKELIKQEEGEEMKEKGIIEERIKLERRS